MTIENPTREQLGELLKQAKRIAVVGLSDKPDRTSNMVSKAMMDNGYEIIPVNPRIKEALGVPAVASLREIEGSVDIVNVFRRAEDLLPVAEEFIQIDCPVFWAQSGIINEEVYEFLKEKGYTVIMDRCIKVEHALTKNM
ncbi:CoA-binding protein [Bacillus sp. AGMB 02131]|uniref:CoA-binding protein n=1 Tax=Peribacillus faecalis TaxID=2772559 RepID=A0A927CTT6_9BACI|nr:CoA-binding protein [Peribacillus faecalis]MBD3107326.1 CoA-binding protein [Peribacillus faecalis]